MRFHKDRAERRFSRLDNLLGNDYSRSDIRGTDWRQANLYKINFSQSIAGLGLFWSLIQTGGIFALAGITGIFSAFSAIWSTGLLSSDNVSSFTILPGSVNIALALIILLITVRKGFATSIVLGIASLTVISSLAIFFKIPSITVFLLYTALTIVQELLALWLISLVSALSKSQTKFIRVGFSIAHLLGLGAILILANQPGTEVQVDWLDITIAISIVLAGGTVGWNAFKPSSKFSGIARLAVYLTAIGGTSFRGSNLTEANFSQARLKYTDFRDANLTRTYWRNAKGLEFSRIHNTYLDNPKIQQLVITLNGQDQSFDGLDLEGVNLTEANLKDVSLVGTNLNNASLQDADLSRAMLKRTQLDGADLSGANLRESILFGTNLTDADLSRADLTGACIKDWIFNEQTCLNNVVCDYVYREYKNDRPTDRYPVDRNFKPGEAESLFQKLTNAVELVFQDQIDWRALSFTFEKFRIEDDGMGLELKGIEQRGDYWIVKVTHGEGVSKQLVEQQVRSTYDDLRALMESKDKQINQLLGIVDNQTRAMHQQAEALTNFSNQPLGNSFFITGSTIKNLAGSGQIEYHEAADQVRSLVTNSADPNQVIPILQSLFMQLSEQKVATTSGTQLEFIQQLIVAEAEKDQAFKQFLTQHEPQIISAMPSSAIATAIQSAIQTVNSKLP